MEVDRGRVGDVRGMGGLGVGCLEIEVGADDLENGEVAPGSMR